MEHRARAGNSAFHPHGNHLVRLALLLLALMGLLATPGWSQGEPEGKDSLRDILRELPVQSRGRLKPLDTLARESVLAITGKRAWQGEDPVLTVMGWWADPEAARTAELVVFTDRDAKSELGLDPDRRWFSAVELEANWKLDERRELIHKRLRNDEGLPPGDLEVQHLLERLGLLEGLSDGSSLRIVPHPGGLEQPWAGLSELPGSPARAAAQQLREKLRQGDPEARQVAVALRAELARLGPGPEPSVLQREVRYNSSHPFGTAWALYLAAFLVLAAAAKLSSRGAHRFGVALAVAGFLVHLYGFGLRCAIAGRPPVTNMYESVIWVAFGAVGFAFLLEWFTPRGVTLPAACACATLCLILADSVPSVLDPGIHPLTPVLRSNFWLTIHVLSITLGYAAFLLALGIGHVALWKAARSGPGERAADILHEAVYKALQVGVLFLAAGTILGGVWANASWGRFWGWDPKEVWALIALLGYLAILHGRYAGWLRKFGVTAWSVLAFQGVLMAWYGVNYVLGTGLHSYGFGTGGGGYVAGFVVFETAFVTWAVARYHQVFVRLRQTHEGGCPFARLASVFSSSTQGESYES